jgi:catechol 2,3-dioxygenase-like lactoylglutathione lyase family enzyme
MATKPKKKQARGTKPAGRPAKTKANAKASAKASAKTKVKAKAKVKVKLDARAAAKPKPLARVASKPGLPERRKHRNLRLRSLSPSFTANDLAKSIHFYVEGLGFTVKQRWEHGGVLKGVMLIAGRCELGLGQDDWVKGRDRVKGVGYRVYAETAQDLGELAERIRAHGYVADGPKAESWGATTVTVTDPDGVMITFHGLMD